MTDLAQYARDLKHLRDGELLLEALFLKQVVKLWEGRPCGNAKRLRAMQEAVQAEGLSRPSLVGPF